MKKISIFLGETVSSTSTEAPSKAGLAGANRTGPASKDVGPLCAHEARILGAPKPSPLHAPRRQAEREAAGGAALLWKGRFREALLGYPAYLPAPGSLSPSQALRAEFAGNALRELKRCELKTWENGRMVKVKIPKDRPSGGVRGKVQGYSRAARKRMLEYIHTVLRTAALPQFFTLTFPDFFPTQQEAKDRMDAWFKRLARKFPQVAAIWRMEVIDRKSGKSKGQVAPHFHLLIWGGLDVNWAAQAWFEVNGKSDYAHLKHGTDAQDLESWAGAVFYCAKYIAAVEGADTFATVGRCWGVHNRVAMPCQKAPSSRSVSFREALTLLRTMRRLCRARDVASAELLVKVLSGELTAKSKRKLNQRDVSRAWKKSRRKRLAHTLFLERPMDLGRMLEARIEA